MTEKERYQSDPEYRKKRLEITKRYYESHRDKVIARVRKWQSENPEKISYAMRKTGGQFSELV